MTSKFIGEGWSFPVELDENQTIDATSQEASIRQSIWMILGTASGERVMRPSFGCGIHELVFAVNSAGTCGRIVNEVRQALIQWEPRIDDLEVNVAPDVNEDNKLLIHIDYRLRSTNNRYNLVYPFYLE